MFFFNDTATTEIYTLSLHDALPIFAAAAVDDDLHVRVVGVVRRELLVKLGRELLRDDAVDHRSGKGIYASASSPRSSAAALDRKSTRLNSSHANISYAVFCLKKKTT